MTGEWTIVERDALVRIVSLQNRTAFRTGNFLSYDLIYNDSPLIGGKSTNIGIAQSINGLDELALYLNISGMVDLIFLVHENSRMGKQVVGSSTDISRLTWLYVLNHHASYLVDIIGLDKEPLCNIVAMRPPDPDMGKMAIIIITLRTILVFFTIGVQNFHTAPEPVFCIF